MNHYHYIDINQLEALQNRTAQFITKDDFCRYSSVNQMKSNIGLESLKS